MNHPAIQTPAQIQANARLAQTLSTLAQIPDADPVKQLLYATLHARQSLDRLDKAIKRDLKRQKGAPDPLYFTPVGQALAGQSHATRRQLGDLAKMYIGLGIEERQTRVIEDWAAVILPFITAFSDDPDLALTRRQREKLPMVVERHLRLIERPEA